METIADIYPGGSYDLFKLNNIASEFVSVTLEVKHHFMKWEIPGSSKRYS